MPDNPTEREVRNDALISEFLDTFEKKAKELVAQASAHRVLSSSLAHGDPSN